MKLGLGAGPPVLVPSHVDAGLDHGSLLVLGQTTSPEEKYVALRALRGSMKGFLAGLYQLETIEIGDWSCSYMPELYAKRKGITPTLRRFETDTRTF